jgi:hypothetical protein
MALIGPAYHANAKTLIGPAPGNSHFSNAIFLKRRLCCAAQFHHVNIFA